MGGRQSKDGTSKGGDKQGQQQKQAGSDAPRLVVIFGATGAQGGSVVQAMKGDPKYRLRAVTRNPDSSKAKALSDSGIEVVKADLDDAESIKAALEGAYGTFAVTNFWELFDADRETAQGKTIVDAAKAAGVQHLIYSGLENVKEAMGKSCSHFDAKAAVEDYIQKQGIPFTCVRYPGYMENLLTIFKPTKNEEGQFVIGFPMGDVPEDMISISETGECIHQIFNNAQEFKGQKIGLSAEKLKVEEYASIINKQLGEDKFVATNMTTDEYAAQGFQSADDLAAMFEFYRMGNPDRNIELTKRLNPNISSFEKWVARNKEAFASME